MPRRAKKVPIKTNDGNDGDIDSNNKKNDNINSKNTTLSNKIDTDDVSDDDTSEDLVRPHRKSRDNRDFDRADYIKARKTPMVTTSRRRIIRDMLLSNSPSNNSDTDGDGDNTIDDISDDETKDVDILTSKTYNDFRALNKNNMNLDLMNVLLLVTSLGESARVEATRMKNISDRADKLTELITDIIKKSDV